MSSSMPPSLSRKPSYLPTHLSTPASALAPQLSTPTSSQHSTPSRPRSIASSSEAQDTSSTLVSDLSSAELQPGEVVAPSSSSSSTFSLNEAGPSRSPGLEPFGDDAPTEAGLYLREQLRRSLSAAHKGKGREVPRASELFAESGGSPGKAFQPRRYFILTDAGKPVYSSSDEPALNTIVGVVQTLVSIFQEGDGDKLRTITSGDTKVVFLLRSPLYYAVASTWGEPDSVLRMHLEYLHLQVLSIITGGQLKRIFERRGNFDLRRLLEGTESFFSTLLKTLQTDFSFLCHSLRPLKIAPLVREAAGQALSAGSKSQGLLYSLLLAGPDLNPVTLLRPKKHSIHPTDLHLLLNLIRSSPALREIDNESWLPICLPKLSQDGFLYAYVTFIRKDIGLVWVSSDKGAFEGLREARTRVVSRLASNSLIERVQDAALKHAYAVGDLEIPGLSHFFYKSCTNVQLTQPRWEDPYSDATEQARLLVLYQKVHDALHGRSNPGAEPLSLVFIRTDSECILGWFTQPFEMYVAMRPSLPKTACVSIANKLARWVRKEEASLFLRDAPVF